MAILKLLNGEELAKAIGEVKTYGAKFDAKVQGVAVQCVAQSILHRNVTPGNDLLNAMPKGSRRDSLVAWFEKHGNFAWMKQEKKLAFYEAVGTAAFTPEYTDNVVASMWTTGTKPAAIKSAYDLEDEFGKVFDRLGKVIEDSSKTIEHRDLYAKLKAVYNSHVAGHVASANDEQVEAAA